MLFITELHGYLEELSPSYVVNIFNTSFKHNLSLEEVASLSILDMLICGNSDYTMAEV